jgi:hypothetical protein
MNGLPYNLTNGLQYLSCFVSCLDKNQSDLVVVSWFKLFCTFVVRTVTIYNIFGFLKKFLNQRTQTVHDSTFEVWINYSKSNSILNISSMLQNKPLSFRFFDDYLYYLTLVRFTNVKLKAAPTCPPLPPQYSSPPSKPIALLMFTPLQKLPPRRDIVWKYVVMCVIFWLKLLHVFCLLDVWKTMF